MNQGDACVFATERKPVYIVYGYMWQYAVAEVFVTSIIQDSTSDLLRFGVEHPVTGDEIELYADEIYEEESLAREVCRKLQKERGHVIISQKEYDEYQLLKAKQPPQEG